MHRLLRIQRISRSNSCGGSFEIQRQSASTICSFCYDHHLKIAKTINYIPLRHKTTIVNTALAPVTKNVKKKSRKYTELVEEQNSNMNNRKARVRNLSPSRFTQLVNQPGTSLDTLGLGKPPNSVNYSSNCQVNIDVTVNNPNKYLDHQQSSLDENSASINNQLQKDKYDLGSIVEDLQLSGIPDLKPALIFYNSIKEKQDKTEAEDEPDILSSTITKNETKETKKKKEMDAKMERLKLLRDKIQIESDNRNLNSYLRVCISGGYLGCAYHTMMFYREKRHLKNSPNLDTSLWNVIIVPYAKKGNLSRIKEFWKILKNDKLAPTVETFAGIFECFSNTDDQKSELKFLHQVYSQMSSMGITFDDILECSKKRLDQYDKVLKTMLLIKKKYQPTSSFKIEPYDCSLLDNNLFNTDFNNNQQIENELMSRFNVVKKFKSQITNEIEGQVCIKSIKKIDNDDPTVIYYRNEVSALEKNWKNVAIESFTRNLINLKNDEHTPIANRMVLYPYLNVLTPQEYVNSILYEVKRLAIGSETFSPTLRSLWRDLGKHINDKYEVSEKRKIGYHKALESVYINWFKMKNNNVNNRISWLLTANDKLNNFDLELESIRWPTNVQILVGKFLYRTILEDLKIDINSVRLESKEREYQQAFFEIDRHCGNKHLSKEIKPHPVLSKIYRRSQPETLNFPSSLIPIECPPRPWTSIHTGGYLISRSDVVRVPIYAFEQWKRLENSPKQQLLPSLDSLNQLSSTPWTVNKKILDLQIKVFQNGGSEKLNVPRPPSALLPIPSLERNATDEERKDYGKKTSEYSQRKNEMYSLWCDALYRLSLANHFRNKIIWLPHNMDFRGRVYPIPPHLNHLGSDLARSILIFADGKPLGKNGLDWLKIHCINLTGLKKRNSIADRLIYANEIIDDILDSAKNPLDGKMWWIKSDEPWQTLAVCNEILNAIESSNPDNYICHFPIHQDGSCNGLQHYAALGRDQIGAENVNLQPSYVPQDVYSSVAVMVNQLRQVDADNGLDIAQLLDGFVTRKVIKQTVMTTVYGVTKFGARLQIAKQLDNLNYPKEHVWRSSLYLADKTFQSLRTMFDSARQIQDWFTECAQIISDKKKKNVEWITPLGLPVVQPYSKKTPSRNKLNDVPIDSCESPNTGKQKSAFPPNFIHSLDSCHMMLTSLHCENAQITFVSVHDCFWTHPCSVEIMNRISRKQFVALHSEPILENLSEFFVKTYLPSEMKSNDNDVDQENADLETVLVERKIRKENEHLRKVLTNIPKKGTFNLNGVLESTYFFC